MITTLFCAIAVTLIITTVAVGVPLARKTYLAQYQRQLEAEIPKWVNQGNQATVIPLADLEDEINFAIWELEMGDR